MVVGQGGDKEGGRRTYLNVEADRLRQLHKQFIQCGERVLDKVTSGVWLEPFADEIHSVHHSLAGSLEFAFVGLCQRP